VVAVAAAVLLLDHIPGLGQFREDAEGAALGVPTLAAMSRSRTPGSWATQIRTRAWLVRKLQLATFAAYSFRKNIAS
jgi:hypothetical protein